MVTDPPPVVCPQCRYEASTVIETRPSVQYPGYTRRRRECLQCGHRWTTYAAVNHESPDPPAHH